MDNMDKFGFTLNIILMASCLFLGIVSILEGENILVILAFSLSSCVYARMAYEEYKNKDK